MADVARAGLLASAISRPSPARDGQLFGHTRQKPLPIASAVAARKSPERTEYHLHRPVHRPAPQGDPRVALMQALGFGR